MTDRLRRTLALISTLWLVSCVTPVEKMDRSQPEKPVTQSTPEKDSGLKPVTAEAIDPGALELIHEDCGENYELLYGEEEPRGSIEMGIKRVVGKGSKGMKAKPFFYYRCR